MISVAPSTYHTLKFIQENPGCTSGEFCNHFGRDLCHIRSPYYSNMLSTDLLGSQPHPRSSLGRNISWAKQRIQAIPSPVPANYDRHIPDLAGLLERGRGRRNWIYRNKPEGSKVFRYWLTAKAIGIIDDLACDGWPYNNCSHCNS